MCSISMHANVKWTTQIVCFDTFLMALRKKYRMEAAFLVFYTATNNNGVCGFIIIFVKLGWGPYNELLISILQSEPTAVQLKKRMTQAT